MRFAQWMCVMAAALICSAAAAAEPCKLQQVAAVEAFIDADGSVYVPVILDGHEGYMALQLSGGLPAIYEGYVDTLGLRGRLQRTDWDAMLGSKKIEKQVKVDSTILAQANFTGWHFQIFPTGADIRPVVNGKPMFGLMSSVFMTAVDLELNLGARRLNLFRPNKCRATPVYWAGEITGADLYVDQSGLMLFPIEVEGKSFEGSLNTTSRLSVISAEATRRYLGFDEDSPGIEHETDADNREVTSFRAMALTAKGLEVRNTRVRIQHMPRCKLSSQDRTSHAVACGDNVLAMTPFSIGTDLMRKLRIYMSVADKKIYFTRAEPAAAAATTAPDGANSGPSAAQ